MYRKLLPFVLLIAVSGLTWYLFFHLGLVTDDEKRLTLIVGILGLTLGAVQFWISEINNKNRREFDLRYATYKEFVSIVDAISETINNEMTNQTQSPHAIVSRLMNLINQFGSSVRMNSDFLFNGLENKKETIKTSDILEKILLRTDKFRKEIDDAANRNPNPTSISMVIVIGQMNWHNETRAYLKELNIEKYSFYKVLREYF